MKRISFVACLVFAVLASAVGSTDADRDWAHLQDKKAWDTRPKPASDEPKVQGWIDWEWERRTFRDLGLAFWDAYPNDPRRYEWLLQTQSSYPFYWGPIEAGARAFIEDWGGPRPVDLDAVRDWNQRYPALKRAFLAGEEVTDRQRRALLETEMTSWFQQSWNPAFRNFEKFDVGPLLRLMQAYNGAYRAQDPPDLDPFGDSFYLHYPIMLFDFKKSLMLEFDDLQRFVSGLRESPAPVARTWSHRMQRLLDLRHRPIAGEFFTETGEARSFEAYRGKFVYCYVWACG